MLLCDAWTMWKSNAVVLSFYFLRSSGRIIYCNHHRTFVYRPNFSAYSTNMDRLTEHTYPTTLQKRCRTDPMSANAVKQNSKRQNTCALAKGTPELNRQSGPTSA